MPIVLPVTTASNSKTFLQLCQLTREKCGISGSGPAAVTAQTGELSRIVNWVQESWLDLQRKRKNWWWMRAEFSFGTIANQQDYTSAAAGISDLSEWLMDTLRAYRTTDGIADEQFLVEWEYQTLRNTYQYGSQTPGRPVVATVRPRDRALLFGSIPDAVYTIRGEYQRAARPFNAGTDVPSIPEEFHMIIVYGAMMKYAFYENAPEVMADARMHYNMLLDQLMENQTDDITLGEPLA